MDRILITDQPEVAVLAPRAQEHRSLSNKPITRLVGELIADPDKIWAHIPSSVETCNMHGVLLLSLAYLGRGQSGAVGQFSLLPR